MNKNQEATLSSSLCPLENRKLKLEMKYNQINNPHNDEPMLKKQVDLRSNYDKSHFTVKCQKSSDEVINIKSPKSNKFVFLNTYEDTNYLTVDNGVMALKAKTNLESNFKECDLHIKLHNNPNGNVNIKSEKKAKRALQNPNNNHNIIVAKVNDIANFYNNNESAEIEKKRLKLDNSETKPNIISKKSNFSRNNCTEEHSSTKQTNSCIFKNSNEKEDTNKKQVKQLSEVDLNKKTNSELSNFSSSNQINEINNSILTNSKDKEGKNKIEQQTIKGNLITKMNSVLCQTIRCPLLSINHIKDNNKAIEFFTGLQNYQKFCYAFKLLGPDAYDLNYYDEMHEISLSKFDQFFMTLVILKLHKSHYEISILFNISLKDIKNIFITWLRFMRLEWSRLKLPRDYVPKLQQINLNGNNTKACKGNSSKISHTNEDVECLDVVETEIAIDNFKKLYKILNGPQNYIEKFLMTDIIFVCHVLCYIRVKRLPLVECALPKL